MEKAKVVERLIAAVRADLEAVSASQKSTQEGAVHEEAKAEDDKDTRAIESQYLARGLAQRVEELRETLETLTSMRLREFGPDDPVAISGLVTLEDEDGNTRLYLLAPAGGGRKIDDVTVVTSQSPIGRAIIGKRAGDAVVIRTPKGARECELTEIQ